MPCRKCLYNIANLCNEGKVMLLLSMVRYKFCFVLDTYHKDAIAINKLCKLNIRYSTMCLTISQQ